MDVCFEASCRGAPGVAVGEQPLGPQESLWGGAARSSVHRGQKQPALWPGRQGGEGPRVLPCSQPLALPHETPGPSEPHVQLVLAKLGINMGLAGTHDKAAAAGGLVATCAWRSGNMCVAQWQHMHGPVAGYELGPGWVPGRGS